MTVSFALVLAALLPGATPRGQVGGGALKDFALTLDSKNRRIQLAPANR